MGATGTKRADVVEVKACHRRTGRLYRIVEKERATGNVIVEQKALNTGVDEVSWVDERKLGKVANHEQV